MTLAGYSADRWQQEPQSLHWSEPGREPDKDVCVGLFRIKIIFAVETHLPHAVFRCDEYALLAKTNFLELHECRGCGDRQQGLAVAFLPHISHCVSEIVPVVKLLVQLLPEDYNRPVVDPTNYFKAAWMDAWRRGGKRCQSPLLRGCGLAPVTRVRSICHSREEPHLR